MEAWSDEALLGAHLTGDRRAATILHARHAGPLAAFLRRLGCCVEPDDIVQITFQRAFAMAGHFRGDASVSTWLHRIAKNVLLDFAKAEKARPADPLDHEPADPRRHDHGLAPAVERALAMLPPDQAEAVLLHYVEGLTAVEIGTRLRLNENTAKSRIRLGADKLRAILGDAA